MATRPAAITPPPSLPDLAWRWLRDAILDGTLPAGEPVRQEDIANRLGVSRLPVREALRRLDGEGLVVLRPRRGYVVASLDPEEIHDVLDLQATLESAAGHAAARRRDPEVLRDLERLAAELERVTGRSPVDVEAFAELNRRFHERLFESCGRPVLVRMLRLLHTIAQRYTRAAAGLLPDLRASQREHRRILDAYRAGDADRVAELCRAHREATRRRLLARLDATKRPARR